MDLPAPSEDDVLAEPVRARLFEALAALRRPATTQELADRVGRHANTTRVQLELLAQAGLIERRSTRQRRGRPRHEWAIAPGARPAGRPPEALGQLSAWLARAMGGDTALADVEGTGREIGRELAPHDNPQPSVAAALHDALTALGFAPRAEASAAGHACFVLGNCPYRTAVAHNQPVVCSLHRGITEGLLERLHPGAALTGFVAKDPFTAGCVVEVGLPRGG
jgi:predicted ArsR family transcriptional regulator